MREIDEYFIRKEEPVKSCLESLRHLIRQQNSDIVEVWRYKMPFYCYKRADGVDQRFCYLWVDKKRQRPYIGIVEGKHFDHPDLISEKRSRMKIIVFDPNEDLPVKKIESILKQAIDLCQNGS